MQRQDKTKKSKLPVFLGIIWGMMLVGFTALFFKIASYKRPLYVMNASYYVSDVVGRNYGSIYSGMENLLMSGLKPEEYPEFDELMAIHDYVESCASYVMYKRNGLEDEAGKYLKIMEEAGNRMGDISFAAGEIDEMLGR